MAADSEPLQQRGHTRSVSAGGLAVISPSQTSGGQQRPSALRKGHQRAFSHGQISAEDSHFEKGHSRVGSKTDFILPPGHKEISSGAVTRGKGHSRQASRTESIYTLRQNETPTRFDLLLNFILRKKVKSDPENRTRTVVPNHIVPPRTPLSSHPNRHTPSNKIRTTKYTFLTFIPKNLIEQFHRVANLYFVFIVILNWVPSINAFGKEVAMVPVLFVLSVTGVKDWFEDRRRRASDKRINNSTCRVYSCEEERYKKTRWSEVRVGDLVHLSNDEVVPADVLLLRSSDQHGTCYLDTCNLDGESNLKMRNIPQGFLQTQLTFKPREFRSVVEVDPPTTKLYHFRGAIVDPNGARTPVSTEHLLLRDSVIKNTDFVEGIVVYAGHETKAMLNNSGPRYKRSSLEKKMNTDIVWCMLILIVLCVIGSVGSRLWLSSFADHTRVNFIIASVSVLYESWLTFWTFIIILQVMIPLSLYVTVEVTKLLQVYHISNNAELFDSASNCKTECRALNITEQLGQIQYIFSDKTGTLTENKMIFRRCTISGVDYNHSLVNSPKGENQYSQIIPNHKLLDLINSDESDESRKAREFLIALTLCNTVVVATHPHVDNMNSSGVIEDERHPPLPGVVETDEPGSLSKYRRLVEARSVTPSPTALPLSGEQQAGSTAGGGGGSSGVHGILDPLERRALSAGSVSKVTAVPTLSPISSAESSPTTQPKSFPLRPNKLLNVPSKLFFSKKSKGGIDGGVSPRSPSSKPIFEAESPDELALVQMAFNYSCKLVLRTPFKAVVSLPGESLAEYELLKVLPFDSSRKCMSVVVRAPVSNEIIVYCKGADSTIFPNLVNPSEESVAEGQVNWYSSQGLRVLCVATRVIPELLWSELRAGIEAAEISGNPNNIRQAYSAVECNLTLLGATGIEDKLELGVAEALRSLKQAGIVVWLLTGDKLETATNVALASGLISPGADILRLAARSKHSAQAAIQFYLSEQERPRSSSASSSRSGKVTRQRAVIVDGKTLTFILDPRSNLTLPFLKLTKNCSAVLCCRVTPLQKAYIVRVVKEQLKMRTLAIGDGANDVSMIQAADVGIGISGQEGMQATMASDFALPKFRFLQRLLIVHGHWAYHRLANLVLYFFYKNATFVFFIFWYQLYCGFSGTVMIDPWIHMLYNLVFTSLPPLALGVYDKDAPEALLVANPHLYKSGRLGLAYRTRSFWIILLDSIYQSLVIFFIAVYAYWGTEIGLWEFGTTITSSCLCAMLVQAAIETKSWTYLHVAAIVISFSGYYIFLLFYNNVCLQCVGLPSNVWVLRNTLGDVSFYLIVLLSTILAVLPRFTYRCMESIFWPNEIVKAVILSKRNIPRDDNFLISWSRSTSTSSINRFSKENCSIRTDYSKTPSTTLTAIG